LDCVRRFKNRGRRTPRVVAANASARSVAELLAHDPKLRDQPWQRYRVRDGEQGPMVWEAKYVRFYLKEETDLPAERPMTLIVARNVLHPEEIKFFLADAPRGTPLGTLLLVGFSRWPVEHCFEDGKDELGMDHYEGRCYVGLKRHLMLTMVSYLFLATVRSEWRGKKSGVDGGPIAQRHRSVDPSLAT
jgi:hypothetical protein